ncbi:MAG: ATP-binding protein [Ilumatobacter sp.]
MAPTTDSRIATPASSSRIAVVREQVRRRAQRLGADQSLIDQFVLVASELATNVVMHTRHEQIEVTIDRDRDGWVIEVSGATDLESAVCTELPPPDSLGGRGLFIVNSLMDDVSVVDGAAGRSVRCVKRSGRA